MQEAGKLIVALGALLAVVGLVLWGFGKLGIRGLPGDIRYESDNVRVYVPIVTCLVLSLVLSLLVWLWRWWRGG